MRIARRLKRVNAYHRPLTVEIKQMTIRMLHRYASRAAVGVGEKTKAAYVGGFSEFLAVHSLAICVQRNVLEKNAPVRPGISGRRRCLVTRVQFVPVDLGIQQERDESLPEAPAGSRGRSEHADQHGAAALFARYLRFPAALCDDQRA